MSMTHRFVATVMTTLLAVPAAAQTDAPRYDPVWHGGIAAGALVGSGLIMWLERNDDPSCHWCGVDAQGQQRVPRMDAWAHRQWRWDDERRAALISHMTAGTAYVWPLAGLTAVHSGFDRTWARDLTAVASSVAVTQFATDLTKRLLLRARPHVVFDRDPIDQPGDVHSFYSGHTASTFAAVVSTAVIAGRRHSRHAAWIWIGGLGLAGSTGYLRIAGNRHYLSDVLVGATMGAATGLILPRVFDGQGGGNDLTTATNLPIAGIGPLARLGPAGAVQVRLGAGARSLGIMGAVDLR